MDSNEKKGNSFELQEEIFELVLHVENSRVTAHDLRLLLFHSERLVKSINKTLRKEYSEYQLGFDIVDLNVLALEKGSFDLKFSISEKNRERIKELTNNATFAAIIGVVVAKLFTAAPETQINQINNTNEETVNNIVVNNNIILNNSTTRNAVDSIAELVIDSDTINGFSIRYMGENGMEEVPISKNQLKETRDELRHREYHKVAMLEFISRDKEDYLWTFRYHGRIIKARIHDDFFLEEVHSGKIDLQRGDFIRVKLFISVDGQWEDYHIVYVKGYYSE